MESAEAQRQQRRQEHIEQQALEQRLQALGPLVEPEFILMVYPHPNYKPKKLKITASTLEGLRQKVSPEVGIDNPTLYLWDRRDKPTAAIKPRVDQRITSFEQIPKKARISVEPQAAPVAEARAEPAADAAVRAEAQAQRRRRARAKEEERQAQQQHIEQRRLRDAAEAKAASDAQLAALAAEAEEASDAQLDDIAERIRNIIAVRDKTEGEEQRALLSDAVARERAELMGTCLTEYNQTDAHSREEALMACPQIADEREHSKCLCKKGICCPECMTGDKHDCTGEYCTWAFFDEFKPLKD